MTSAEVIVRLLKRHGWVNLLLEAPWVKTSIFKMDWLHAADQGITADFIGNVFHHFVQSEQIPCADIGKPLRTAKLRTAARYQQLHLDMQEWYAEQGVADRMDALKPSFVEARQGMKLRTSAAKCRALVPFVYKMCSEICDMRDPIEEAIYWASFHLNKVYCTLASGFEEPLPVMKESSIQFATQYVALHDHLNKDDERVFRIKPKLHFFLHLCSDGGLPAMHWCYRDEDYGGSVAKASRRRGGMRRPQSTSLRVLNSEAIGTPRVSIR